MSIAYSLVRMSKLSESPLTISGESENVRHRWHHQVKRNLRKWLHVFLEVQWYLLFIRA